MAAAAAVATPAHARCDNHAPVSGETVTCTTALPNPDSIAVTASPISSNVTVNVNAGAAITGATAAGAVRIVNDSRVENSGSIQAPIAQGVNAIGSGNTIVNFGQIAAVAGPGVRMAGGGTLTNMSGAT